MEKIRIYELEKFIHIPFQKFILGKDKIKELNFREEWWKNKYR